MKFTNLTQRQLEKLAIELAKKSLKTGAVIGLNGNLGAGKTTFAKAFVKVLRIKSLKSPTFIVNQQYKLSNRSLFHLDFYRLDNMAQLNHLGLDELLMRPNIVLIEWVEKFPKIERMCDILINLKVKPQDKRDVEVKFRK